MRFGRRSGAHRGHLKQPAYVCLRRLLVLGGCRMSIDSVWLDEAGLWSADSLCDPGTCGNWPGQRQDPWKYIDASSS
jgi:hypothetical protein